MIDGRPLVSIVMLTHNAPKYVKITLDSIAQHTRDIDYELIVFDNGSDAKTRKMLTRRFNGGAGCDHAIDKLVFSKANHLFAKGNNYASRLCSPDSDYVLLMNSDIEVRSDSWLSSLVEYHASAGKGATGYGFCEGNPIDRADGYCLLFDRDLYDAHLLDEEYEWFWSITKIEAQLLNEGYRVTAVADHENMIHHFGGKSGPDFANAKGMDADMAQVVGWFDPDRKVTVVPSLS